MAMIVISLSIFLDVALFGLFLASSLVEHAMRNLPQSTWLPYKQAKERVFGPIMPALFGAGLLLSLVAAFVAREHLRFGVAAAFMVATLVITVAIHLPLNRRFQSWDRHSTPAEWSDLRSRWRNWNWLRTVLVGAAAIIVFS